MLQLLLEDRGKFHNQRVPDDRNFLSVGRGLQETGTFHGTRWDVGLHVPYVKYEWKTRSWRSLKDSLPLGLDVFQLAQLPPKLMHTVQ
jgi:hypothetical protein